MLINPIKRLIVSNQRGWSLIETKTTVTNWQGLGGGGYSTTQWGLYFNMITKRRMVVVIADDHPWYSPARGHSFYKNYLKPWEQGKAIVGFPTPESRLASLKKMLSEI